MSNLASRGAGADPAGFGIRLGAGRLVVRNCPFYDNEMGILTANCQESVSRSRIPNSPMACCSLGQGSAICSAKPADRPPDDGQLSHDGRIGHLPKSRAAVSHVSAGSATRQVGSQLSDGLPEGARWSCWATSSGRACHRCARRPIASLRGRGCAATGIEFLMVANTLVDDAGRRTASVAIWFPERPCACVGQPVAGMLAPRVRTRCVPAGGGGQPGWTQCRARGTCNP